MAETEPSAVRRFLNKIAVKETEPGLTTAQLMLINEDLKPGMWGLIRAP
jgi:hypothetical protein